MEQFVKFIFKWDVSYNRVIPFSNVPPTLLPGGEGDWIFLGSLTNEILNLFAPPTTIFQLLM